jgi:small subunit ribosomal protein S8
MSVNDPISDMLTRIRNAGMARQTETTMPSTKILVAIAKILKEEGYIEDYRVIEKRPQDQLVVQLRYDPDRRHTIREVKRISKPGLRVYSGKNDIPRVRSGLGIAIVSTPEGVFTGYEARRRGIGGEVLCTVW